ncbi:MAG: Flp family type IVb pilin [Gimesia sp.]|uniref:Flp family type IVb pilin n=1 Tax=Gimesia maris TaxID=122 RepID=A0A3D3R572_9PLAN|nr:Flp family type IVb pilin [Gimesia sp.]HCO23955.1 Flp family type IVb pilin [Gimesia maris]
MQYLKKFLVDEDGPTAVEYAVMLAAIVMVCIAAIAAIGTRTNGLFENATTEMHNHGM